MFLVVLLVLLTHALLGAHLSQMSLDTNFNLIWIFIILVSIFMEVGNEEMILFKNCLPPTPNMSRDVKRNELFTSTGWAWVIGGSFLLVGDPLQIVAVFYKKLLPVSSFLSNIFLGFEFFFSCIIITVKLDHI